MQNGTGQLLVLLNAPFAEEESRSLLDEMLPLKAGSQRSSPKAPSQTTLNIPLIPHKLCTLWFMRDSAARGP
jgi:hypothetical protein